MVLGALALALLLLSAGAYALLGPLRKLIPSISTNVTTRSKAASADPVYNPLSDFDLTIQLNGDPLGLACNAGEFVIGN
jgi:hypothetical protein